MKKSLIAISTAALALCLASVPLVGCGGNSGGGATTGDAPAAVKAKGSGTRTVFRT